MAAIQADGTVLPQQQVNANGVIALPAACGVVHIGLPYVAQIQGMNFNVQNQPSIRNHAKTVPRLSVVIDQSSLFYAGTSFDNLVQAELREFEDYGVTTNLATGVTHIPLMTQPDDDAAVCIEMPDPAPLTVLAWQADVDIGQAG